MIAKPQDRREQRRRAFLAAARTLFVERGYDAVSLADVVKLSGGSLTTLYDLFENKQGLLREIVIAGRSGGNREIDAIIERGDPPRITLRAIAEELHCEMTDPETIGLIRIAVAEGLRTPEFAQQLYATAHGPFLARLASLFEGWASAGLATIPQPRLAAEMFLALVLYGHQTRLLFGAGELPFAREEALGEAVAIFASAYAVAP